MCALQGMKIIEEKFKIPQKTIRYTFSEIYTIATNHAMFIILYKRQIENNESILVDRNLQ